MDWQRDKGFYLGLILISAGLYGLGQLLAIFTGISLHPWTFYIQLFHVLLTILSYHIIMKGTTGEGIAFITHFFGHSTVRLLLSGAVLAIYIYGIDHQNKLFAVTFFIFYFFYTVFEIRLVLSKLRQNLERGGKN